jgi:hypothetical protein
MRKLIVLITVLVFVLSGLAAASTWQDYKDAKKKANDAEATGDTYNAVTNYKKAADVAAEFKKIEIQAWQLNNAAHALIQTFKKAVDYDAKLQKLSAMEPSDDKIAFQKEMATAFNPLIGLLNEAKGLLDQATDLKPQESTDKIKSNTDFIDWVTKFTTENMGTAEAAGEASAEGNTKEAKEEVKPKAKEIKAAATIAAPAKVTGTAATPAAEE